MIAWSRPAVNQSAPFSAAASIVYPGAALCEEDANDCRMRGLLASIGAWLRTMDEAELRRVDACVVEILRGRED